MKKQLSLFVATLATLFITLSASAQGEWKWANYWTGNDDPLNSTNPYNYIVRTDRKSTRLNSSHIATSRMPSSA